MSDKHITIPRARLAELERAEEERDSLRAALSAVVHDRRTWNCMPMRLRDMALLALAAKEQTK